MTRSHNTIAARANSDSDVVRAFRAKQAQVQQRKAATEQRNQRHADQAALALKLLKAERKPEVAKEKAQEKRMVASTDTTEDEIIAFSAREHTSALRHRLAECVIANFVDARPDKAANISKVQAAKAATRAQVPASLVEKYSVDGKLPGGNPIDGGLNKGAYFLRQAGDKLYPSKGQNQSQS